MNQTKLSYILKIPHPNPKLLSRWIINQVWIVTKGATEERPAEFLADYKYQ